MRDMDTAGTDHIGRNSLYAVVTGASGFIGTWLCKRLRELGYEVIGLSQRDGDISRNGYFDNIKYNINHVFHLASKTFVPDSWEDPGDFYRTNVIGTLSVLEFCRRKSIPLTFVSAYIYGAQESQPISESAVVLPTNPYAHSKHLAEQLCEFYADTFSIGCTIIRPFNVYGHGQSERFLIPTVINQVLSRSEVRVRDLAPKRDFIYVNDLVEILVLTTKIRKQFSIYNAGSGHSLSVLDIITTIAKLCGKNVKIIEEGVARERELHDTVADITKAQKDLTWTPQFSFEKGIADILRQLAVL